MSELKLQQCRLDGRYDVRECLGRGAYSEVYMADDEAAANGSPRTVVIKALNTHLQGVPDPELERTLIENFRNEAIALDRVRHPNIISRLGHGTAIDLQGRTFHYLVLEYLPGGDLQAFVLKHPLPLEGALFYLEQVCAGLAHAHRHDVIHRDIKPQNLLLTADQHVLKIADFGVAKIEAAEGLITRVGTDVYAAPEHHPLAVTGPLDTASLTRRVAQLTPAADIYSLAKTTYMLLTGEPPRRFSRQPITSLPHDLSFRPWSQYVLRVLERATQTNPSKRHQSVEEFWQEIKDATMAQTRPLRPSGGADDPGADKGPVRGSSLATPPPPAPTFDREARGVATDAARHRIVVPISHGGGPPAVVEQPRPPAPKEVHPTEQYIAERRRAAAFGQKESSRARSLIVALLLLLAFSGMLYATYRYVNDGQRAAQTGQGGAGGGGTTSPPAGREFVTTTDVNLREGPDRSTPEVGMAEKGSRVRVLQTSGRWYLIQVIEHGRAKERPDSRDEGWAHSAFLKAR